MAPVHEPIGLFVQPGLSVPDSELEVSATRAGGPGGQHVNTSSTRVEVRWRVATLMPPTTTFWSRGLASVTTGPASARRPSPRRQAPHWLRAENRRQSAPAVASTKRR